MSKGASTRDHHQVYDVTDLKAKIVQLKILRQQRSNEKENIQVELNNKERYLNKLKQEYILLSPDEQLRWAGNNPVDYFNSSLNKSTTSLHNLHNDTSSSDGPADPDSQRFWVWNEKLEMSILIQEIRQALPKLEIEANYYEKQTQYFKKLLLRSEIATIDSITESRKQLTLSTSGLVPLTEDGSSLLLKTRNELQEETEKIANDIIDIKLNKKLQLEEQKKKNANLLAEINALKKEINLKILKDRSHLKKFSLEIDQDLMNEQKKVEVIKNDILSIRKELDQMYLLADNNSTSSEKDAQRFFTWQRELFLQETGSDKTKLPIKQIGKLLTSWIYPGSNGQPISLTNLRRKYRSDELENWQDERFIQRLVDDIRLEQRMDDDNSSSVDIKTFCLLCNNLILLLE